jgi:DNA ligase-1
MKLPTLYSRTNTGAIQTWTIEIEGEIYRTIHGQLDGKLQTTEWTVCDVTNFGRSNQRNPAEQALFEAQAAWQKRKDTGYHEDINSIDIQQYVEPMLAKKWEDRKDKVKFPLYCQPKLDGLRAVISRKGAYSRNGKKWVTIPFILEGLENVFNMYPDLVLDGELYNHNLKDDFNKITSLVKKQKPSAKDLNECKNMVQFWWYDIADDTNTFSERNNLINHIHTVFNLGEYGIKVVPTYLAENNSQLDSLYEQFLDNGYEGQMVRENTKYEFKRSASLLKRKEFQDDEFVIMDILEGNGNRSGLAGAMVFVNKLGHQFNSNIKGDRDYLQELWVNKGNYIGKKATVRYFNLTPDKLIPRFPFVYGIRDFE